MVRFSNQNISLIKGNLNHINPDIRRLAVEMTGIYKIAELSADITKLLNDKDENVKRATYRAFGQIGKVAISELLSEIRNSENSAENKIAFIYALNNIGFSTPEISKTFADMFSQAEEIENKSLLRALLLVSAQLRDPNQIKYAINLLSDNDERIALAAAKYLTEVPDKSSWDTLWKILCRIISEDNEKKDFHYYTLINQIIAALLLIDRDKAESEIYKLIEDGLSERNKLGLMQSERLIKKHDLAVGYPLILDRLITGLENPPPQNFASSLAEMLGSTWKPESLEKLIEKTAELKSQQISISEVFVKAITPNMKEHDVYPIAEGINRVSDLETLIKCQSSDFISKVKPLFVEASELSTREFCNYFWLIGDVTIENDLIKKFKNLSEYEAKWYARDKVLRALGTCGTKLGAEFILSYLKNNCDISLAFPNEGLFPLLQRKVLLPEKLAEFCRNKNNNAIGRAVCLFALADYSASQFTDLFIEATTDNDPLVRKNAVIALSFTKDRKAVNVLREILAGNSGFGIKGVAAGGLIRLNADEAVSEIEDVIEDCDEKDDLPIANLLDALSYFHSESSVPIILNRLETASRHNRGRYLEALGSFLFHPDAARKISQELERCAESSTDYFNEQSLLVSGVTFKWNKEFYTKILGFLKRSRLSEHSRLAICRNLPRVFKSRSSDKNIIAQIMQILLSDYDLDIRDRALNALTIFPKDFSRKIYQAMIDDPNTNEWKRACAVESLGFWKSDSAEINKMKFDKELLVRRSANGVVENKNNFKALSYHLSEFQNTSGIARLSAYLCLAENGNLATIWELNKTRTNQTFAFTNNLIGKINKQREKKIKDNQKEQDKQLNERGTIYFD